MIEDFFPREKMIFFISMELTHKHNPKELALILNKLREEYFPEISKHELVDIFKKYNEAVIQYSEILDKKFPNVTED